MSLMLVLEIEQEPSPGGFQRATISADRRFDPSSTVRFTKRLIGNSD
jgi:hypothetical protein